jgi:Esterase PHB depolymerase
MDSTGWLFVPASCANGQACRLVIALHGCLQYQGIIQEQFVQESGINEWADTNNIIVLYPQATASFISPSNPLGCWDWFANTGPNYTLKTAPQMQAIMGMVSQITSGKKGNGGVPTAPTGLTGATISSVSLIFSPISAATSYNVYRNGNKVGTTSSNSYRLTANTTYTYTVTAVNNSGESPQSSAVNATPCGPTQ